MMKAFKRWLAAAAVEGLQETKDETRINKLHDMFSSSMPAMVAFKIDNGYVVRCMNPEAMLQGGRIPGFAYCADHRAIADYIVTQAMKNRLGAQQEMFPEPVQQYPTTAGLVGAKQANPSY
jgi:hypothetical protein